MPARQVLMTPNLIRIRALRRKRRKQGLCNCGRYAVPHLSTCTVCHEVGLKTRIKLRRQVLDAYGAHCVCCGESEYHFLSIDHKNGNGNQHRLSIGGSKKANIVSWLIRNKFPEGFQILCHNCNMAKGCYGVCPHEQRRQESAAKEG